MHTITPGLEKIFFHLSSPSRIWKVILRKDFGRNYLISDPDKRIALAIPLMVFFAPFLSHHLPLWEKSIPLTILCGIALLRISWILPPYLMNEERKDVPSDYRGNTLRWIRKCFPFLKTEEAVKLIGESFIALLIGVFFVLSDIDDLFGWIMVYVGLWHFMEELVQVEMEKARIAAHRDGMLNGEKEKKRFEEAKEQIRQDRNKHDRDQSGEEKVFRVK